MPVRWCYWKDGLWGLSNKIPGGAQLTGLGGGGSRGAQSGVGRVNDVWVVWIEVQVGQPKGK